MKFVFSKSLVLPLVALGLVQTTAAHSLEAKLDEKEGVIRQQQVTIQELRVQITNEQRSY